MRIGIDLGGTKIEGIAMAADNKVLHRERRPTPAGDYPATLDAIVDMISSITRIAGTPTGIGIGIPGAISPSSGLVKNANSTCLIGHPLDRDLDARILHPIRIANDADCFALSEARDGAGRDHETVFGVILGTGVGGGFAIGGRLHDGPNAIAGEWGHNPLPWPEPAELPGPPCYCGMMGCIETYLSGPGLSGDHMRHTGKDMTPPQIVAAAQNGDKQAEETLGRYEDRLARALAMVINILDPAAIVLGGGLSQIERLYSRVPERWTRYVFSDVVHTPLLPPRHGDASGVRGAAWLWPE